MKNLEEVLPEAAKTAHPVAKRLEELIRKKLVYRQSELGMSDEALGARTFKPLGWNDAQKKANNLMRGRTRMLLSDFYILCEGLELLPDRVFTACLSDALEQVETEAPKPEHAFEKKQQDKEEGPYKIGTSKAAAAETINKN